MRTLNLTQCKDAINNWSTSIKNKDEITSLLQPNFNIPITKKIYTYLEDNNENDNFHIYMGITDSDKIIMIFIPLCADGMEKLDLSSYAISSYESLVSPLVLRESNIGNSESKYTISSEFSVGDVVCEQTPSAVKPMITINEAMVNLTNWKLGYEDWIDFEVTKGTESKIFKAFSVGMEDLIMGFNKSWIKHISCLFVLEKKDTLNPVTANVIFISSYDSNFEPNSGISVSSNVYDFGRPCPPLCKSVNFGLLDL